VDHVEATDAHLLKPKAVRWVWRELIPAGMLSLIAGVPGSSKSVLAALIAAEVSRSGGQVVKSNLEDPREEVQIPRLMAARANMHNVTLFGARLGHGRDVVELSMMVEDLAARLLILDPLAAHIPPTREALLPLVQAARRAGCAILGIHHTTKRSSSGMSAMDRIAGATGGALGTARAVYVFGPNPGAPETERVLAPVKVNVRRTPRSVAYKLETRRVQADGYDARLPILTLSDEASPVTADAILSGRVDEDRDRGWIAAAAEWVSGYLRMGGRPGNDVLEDAMRLGVGEAPLMRAAELIGVVVEDTEDGELWRLPESHPFA
jgi:putative DNA primase/helicase